MQKKGLKNSCGRTFKSQKTSSDQWVLMYYTFTKLIIKPSQEKLEISQSHFQNECRVVFVIQYTHLVNHFMVLIGASTRWSHICLLSTHNQVFAKLLVQLRAHFPNYPIKKICFDNTSEIKSHVFHEYCISIGIKVEYPVAHVHTQNRFTESLLKRLKLVARLVLMRANLLMATWGYTILHVALLIHIKPTSYHKYSIMQLVFVNDLIFSCNNFWVWCICFSHQKGLWWVLKDNWEYMFDMILPQY